MSASKAPVESPDSEQLPRYSASGQPVTRAYRIAWQIWVVAVLLTLVTTLILYLLDKLILKA